jgi:hypothetical protein
VRELIYLSTVKLRQFRPDRPAGRWRRVREVDAQAPLNLGGLRFAFPDDAESLAADLNRVVRFLHVGSAKPPRWYTEDGLEPGQWVHFEARMNYEVVGAAGAPGTPVLVFWDQRPGPVRLLLHGSPKHLVSATKTDEPAMYSTVSEAHTFLRALADVERQSTDGARPSVALVASLLAELDTFPVETATSFTGLARVTGVLRNGSSIVVASPLYVEYNQT